MKLLVIAPSYHPFTGGVEKHLAKVYGELATRGHRIIMLVRYRKDMPGHQCIGGIDVYRLPSYTRLPAIWCWKIFHPRIFANANVIHSHDVYLPALKKLMPHTRWVHTFHGYEGYPISPLAIAGRQKIRQNIPTCFCVGKFIEKWYGTKCDYELYGAVEQKIHEGPIKIEFDAIFYGRLEPDTGFKEYLEAFKMIADQDPSARMLVLGNGSLKKWAEKFIETHSLNVSMKDFVPDVIEYLRQAKTAFVSGYLAILEAAANRKPIVAYWGTPIKKDYLEMHPCASDMFIAGTAEEIAIQYSKALKAESMRLDRLQSWAKGQTWSKIADIYEKEYTK